MSYSKYLRLQQGGARGAFGGSWDLGGWAQGLKCRHTLGKSHHHVACPGGSQTLSWLFEVIFRVPKAHDERKVSGTAASAPAHGSGRSHSLRG